MATDARSVRGLSSKGPARRTAIARAGAEVLRTSGIEGLTHRAVAEQAHVPLGSTTYYFASRDELLLASIEHATESSIQWLQAWGGRSAGSDIGVALPQMLYEYLTEHRVLATFDVEMYVLASRRPALRPYTRRWTTSFVEVLSAFVDLDTARHLAVAFNGLLLIGVATDGPASLEEISRVCHRALTTDDPLPTSRAGRLPRPATGH